jgi:hypothetical protein
MGMCTGAGRVCILGNLERLDDDGYLLGEG